MCKLQGLPRSSNISPVLHSQHHDDDDDDGDHISSPEMMGAEPSSACLWAMVNDFLETDTSMTCSHNQIFSRAASLSARNSYDAVLKRALQEMNSILGSFAVDAEEAKIASSVAKTLIGLEIANTERALLVVLRHLKREGYDAGLCATERKLGNAGVFPPTGGHRFIDVIMEEKQEVGISAEKRLSKRLIVDVGFCGHFEIARPLPAYQRLISMLPSTFIGKAEPLQRVVRIMSQAAKASLESQGMPIPPWRSFSFLHAKWFSSCSTRISWPEEAICNITNCSPSTNQRILVDRNNKTDSANLMLPGAVHHRACEKALKAIVVREDAVQVRKAWHPSPATNQIYENDDEDDDDDDDKTRGTIKRRVQANVVSALTLTLVGTQYAHMPPECVVAAVKV